MRFQLRPNVRLFVALLCLGAALPAVPSRVLADEECVSGEYEREHDHERARRALECGEVMPLADVLAAVRPHISGTIIETEFEREDGVWVYALKIIDSRGRLEEVYIDARTARILKSERDE